jgi:thioesterase domain-containing protein/acyl carrier protein
VVLQRSDRPGQEQLVAYLVPKAGGAPSVSSLRRSLAAQLSAVMIPARYVFLDELPLDRNGKVARKSLLPPGRERPRLDQPYLAPASPLETTIAACFSDCLGIDRIGGRDDFFDLGGDSLAATELLLLIQERTEKICSENIFFDDPCVAAIAEALAGARSEGCLVPLRAEGSLPPLFIFHNLLGHLLEYHSLVRLLDPARPVFGLQSRPAPAGTASPSEVEDMVETYLREITAQQPEGPYYLCGNCFGGMLAFEAARQLKALGQEVAFVGMIDTAFFGDNLDRFAQFLALGKHWQRLARGSLGEGFAYLARLIAETGRRATLAARRRSIWRPQAPSILEINRKAQGLYQPKGYDGPVVLFCLGEPYNQLGWKSVALGDFNIAQLPWTAADSERPHLLQEPQVHDLVKAIDAILEPKPSQ